MSKYDLERYTCKRINQSLDYIRVYVEDTMEEICDGYVDGVDIDFEEKGNKLYKDVAEEFEKVRSLNELLRDSAEKVISKLENRIAELEKEVERLTEINHER